MATLIEKQVKKFPETQRKVLLQVRDMLSSLLPGAEETISWGMPGFKVAGVTLICFQGFNKHNSIFPMSGSVPALMKKELAGLAVSKGTIQFDLEKAPPRALLKKIIEIRIKELNEKYPLKSGAYLQFYDNGNLQSRGRYKGKAMHGKWEWFRRDGSKMRSGAFDNGEQVGTWVTYDRASKPVKTTKF